MVSGIQGKGSIEYLAGPSNTANRHAGLMESSWRPETEAEALAGLATPGSILSSLRLLVAPEMNDNRFDEDRG